MFGNNICIFEKFATCKNGDSCNFDHPTLVCDDRGCDIRMCFKKHPQDCLYYTNFNNCKHGDSSCKFLHRKNASDTIDIEKYRDLESKYNEILENYKNLQERLVSLEKFTDGLHQRVEVITEEKNEVTEDERTRKHGDVKRKLNSEEKETVMTVAEEAPAKKIVIECGPPKENRSLEGPLVINHEYLNIKYLCDEISKIKDFVIKERMVSKGVNEGKKKLLKLKFEMRKRATNQTVEIILMGMFESLCEKVQKKVMNKSLKKDDMTDKIDEFLDICKKEKIKYESKLNQLATQ